MIFFQHLNLKSSTTGTLDKNYWGWEWVKGEIETLSKIKCICYI